MGFKDEFDYKHPADIFREHAALSGFENNKTRAFDISAYSDISYESLIHIASCHYGLETFDHALKDRITSITLLLLSFIGGI